MAPKWHKKVAHDPIAMPLSVREISINTSCSCARLRIRHAFLIRLRWVEYSFASAENN